MRDAIGQKGRGDEMGDIGDPRAKASPVLRVALTEECGREYYAGKRRLSMSHKSVQRFLRQRHA